MKAAAALLGTAILAGTSPANAQIAVQAAADAPKPTRVLILYSIAPEAYSATSFTNEFRRSMRRSLPGLVEFYEEFLDFTRFNGPERIAQLARAHREKYQGVRFDVVVPVGSSAIKFAVDSSLSLFPGLPIVFVLALEHRVNRATLPPNVTGRTSGTPFVPTLALARSLQPGARNIFVVSGAAAPDSNLLVIALEALAARRDSMRDTMKVFVLQGQRYRSLMDTISRLPPRSMVLFASFERDADGNYYDPVEVVAEIAARANAPVYAQVANSIGRGIVGGALAHYDVEGALTADLVLRALRRAPDEPMPPVAGREHSMHVDWRQLQRWGLPESRLPSRTIVRFKVLTAWERHRTPIVLALGLFVIQSLLLIQVWVEHRRRVRAQRVVEEQLAFERLISGLSADLADNGTDLVPLVLERALGRLGNFFGARAAIIADYVDDRIRCVRWPANAGDFGDASLEAASHASQGASPMVFPLVAASRRIGTLELQPVGDARPWSERQATQMRLAADVIGGAIARDQAARAARHSEQLNRAVLASVSAQIAILDGSGRIVRVNDAWRQGTIQAGIKTERDAFVGMSYLEECRRAVSRGDSGADDIRRGIEAVLAGESWRFRCEYQSAAPERWYELYVDRLEHAEGGAVVTHLDVTDRRRAELLAEEARQQVAHMARVLTVGELAATLVHELGQPLTAIGNNAHAGAHLVGKPQGSMVELKAILDDIASDQARAAEVVRRVRAMLRKDHPSLEHIDVNEVCRGVRSLLRADAGKRRATIELSLDSSAPTVLADPVQLQQVVINLVVNGLEAVSTSDGPREVCLRTSASDGCAGLFVYDSGSGLPHAAGQLLFEPFFSTKTHGLGMGLAIVRSFVERHGGHVQAENRPGGGAVFRMLLPLAKNPPPPRHSGGFPEWRDPMSVSGEIAVPTGVGVPV